ncbi:hypothetical protein D3C77_780440 [compost metagenome]
MARAQGVGQGLFVDKATTGGIDDKGARFEQRQFFGTDQVARVFVEGAVQGQGIDLRQ